MQIFDGLLNQTESDPGDVRSLYDEWAAGYDQNLREWGYEAPAHAAAYARRLAEPDAIILDAGCGTGMSGEALRAAGFSTVDGIDFSADSVALAEKRGVYRQVSTVDLTSLPTVLPEAHYQALVCVGVMSYLPAEPTCREFCRVTARGAPIIVTQRSDLFDQRGTQAAFDAIARDGLWQQIEITAPKPYLPGNPEFEGVGVHYCVFQRI